MNVRILTIIALSLTLAAPALAQEWDEFVSVEDQGSVEFLLHLVM